MTVTVRSHENPIQTTVEREEMSFSIAKQCLERSSFGKQRYDLLTRSKFETNNSRAPHLQNANLEMGWDALVKSYLVNEK